jgi:hypothetical protein
VAIPEPQLTTWAKIGSLTQSADTYATIRACLDDKNAPYNGHVNIFLQGSYGNHTNVFGRDSDVDIVVQSDQAYFRDLSRLSPQQKTEYLAAAGGPPDYPFAVFKADVIKVLKQKFGVDVDTSGTKAVKIKASGNRRSADVLISQDFRRYTKYTGSKDDYIEGIGFETSDGVLNENYPELHTMILTAKHQVTKERLKPAIRIFKNMRNRLVDEKKLQRSVAPSYYIESLMWNAPNGNFADTYSDTIFNCLKWMTSVDESKLLCANAMFPLFGNNSLVMWSPVNFRTFRSRAIDLWNEWQ